MLFRTFLILLISLPSAIMAQLNGPLWLDEDFRKSKYPSDAWFCGYTMDKIKAGEKLIEALQRAENSAKSKLIEQIQISISSTSTLDSRSTSKTIGEETSEVISVDYSQQIKTSTSASAVGVEIESHYDTNGQLIYAFAYVEKKKLIEYYINQEASVIEYIKGEFVTIDELENSGQKIAAYERCLKIKDELPKAKEFRMLISAIAGTENAYSERYIETAKTLEKKIVRLSQATKVFVSCIWKCPKYPHYGNVAEAVKENVCALLSQNNCNIVNKPEEADYTLYLTASTTMRSDGSDKYGIISYYADVTGKLTNRHSNKVVVNIALIQDPRLYSAGKNEGLAIAKAFRSQSFMNVIKETVLPGIKK